MGGAFGISCCYDGENNLIFGRGEEYCYRNTLSIDEVKDEAGGLKVTESAGGRLAFAWNAGAGYRTLSLYSAEGRLVARQRPVAGETSAAFTGLPRGTYGRGRLRAKRRLHSQACRAALTSTSSRPTGRRKPRARCSWNEHFAGVCTMNRRVSAAGGSPSVCHTDPALATGRAKTRSALGAALHIFTPERRRMGYIAYFYTQKPHNIPFYP